MKLHEKRNNNSTQKAIVAIAKALSSVFQDFNRQTRQKAIKQLTNPDGRRALDQLAQNPKRPLNQFPKLAFKDWNEETELALIEECFAEAEAALDENIAGYAAKAIGQLGARATNAMVSGLGTGVMSGLKRAGNVFLKGQEANHMSLKYKDVMKEIESLMRNVDEMTYPTIHRALETAYSALSNAYNKTGDWRPRSNPIIGNRPRQ